MSFIRRNDDRISVSYRSRRDFALGSFAPAQPSQPRRATPIEPISAIVQQFRSHAVVALGDNEASVQGSDFRIKLVRDPRLVGAVNDIVVEFGNSRYQD